jgi:tRNA A-37 threonylcarbamoyl transferase component Bud32
MRRLLSAHVRSHLGDDEITTIRHRLVKHTPGKRCVIEYCLDLNGGRTATRRVFGKLYRKNRGEKIFANLQSLWRATPHQQTSSFGMPEPLAYLPELGMVLQSAVSGRQFTELSPDDDLQEAVRHIARNLAVLHGLDLVAEARTTMDDHVRKYCRPTPLALMTACPELAARVKKILLRFVHDNCLQQAPVCPVHGDLGFAQIFIAGDQAFFIDFDGFGLSHAALDVANFLVALKIHFGSQSSTLAEFFLESYLETQSPEKLTGLGPYQALACLRRALIAFRSQNGSEWRRQVQQFLDAGLAASQNDHYLG